MSSTSAIGARMGAPSVGGAETPPSDAPRREKVTPATYLTDLPTDLCRALAPYLSPAGQWQLNGAAQRPDRLRPLPPPPVQAVYEAAAGEGLLTLLDDMRM